MAVTDVLYDDAFEASQFLGIPEPDKVIPIVDVGQFVRAAPPTVQPSFRFVGGGNDFTNPEHVLPHFLMPARKIF